jgi:hypothetical protein
VIGRSFLQRYDAAAQKLYRSAKEKYICWYRRTIRPRKVNMMMMMMIIIIIIIITPTITVNETA